MMLTTSDPTKLPKAKIIIQKVQLVNPLNCNGLIVVQKWIFQFLKMVWVFFIILNYLFNWRRRPLKMTQKLSVIIRQLCSLDKHLVQSIFTKVFVF